MKLDEPLFFWQELKRKERNMIARGGEGRYSDKNGRKHLSFVSVIVVLSSCHVGPIEGLGPEI